MPDRNGITKLLLVVACCASGWNAGEAQPLVIGYERFHAEVASPEGGRLLFNELGCVNCHYVHTDLPPYQGPVLNGILDHKNPEWVMEFLLNPGKTKPGTRMPDPGMTPAEVEAVTHYLATLKPGKKMPNPFRFTNSERGLHLYHDMGCVACHGPSGEFDPSRSRSSFRKFTYPQLPFIRLEDRYDQASLSAFLYRPYDYRPHGRMPQFTLDREDGGDLAAYLLNFHAGDSREYPPHPESQADPGLALQGKAVVKRENCVACHAIKADNAPLPGKYPIPSAMRDLNDIPGHPDFGLSDQQVKSLRLFLEGKTTLQAPVITHLQALNCLACHERNGMGGPDEARQIYFTGDPDLGDAGSIPPPLSEVGGKLQPDWLRGVLEGDNQVRPYLNTRMPRFGKSVHGLGDRIVLEDRTEARPKFLMGDKQAGGKLLGTQGGLNCITCHHWGDRKSLGIQALDISNVARRLNFEWFHDYLIDPAAYRSNTLMPSFWPGGEASNREILDGDTRAQIEAIYAFASLGEGIPEGFPEHHAGEYEIVPADRPVVQRAFVEGVGPHALLVGFPEGVHLAFNGETGRPAMVWKGRFFDAYQTWFSRFPEFEKPLGKDVVRFPETFTEGTIEYKGYRLDNAGIPEFILHMNGAALYERFQPVNGPNGKPALQRTVRYTSEAQWGDPGLNHPEEANVWEMHSSDRMTRTFIYQW